MIKELINRRIQDISNNVDIVVLKGFSASDIRSNSVFPLLLTNILTSDNKIDLECINSNEILRTIIELPANPRKPVLMLYEPFLLFISSFNNIDILNKSFCILDNNLLNCYENPTTCDIPDFDSDEFQSIENESQIYAPYYSFCEHIGDRQFVQYNEPIDLSSLNHIDIIPFVTTDVFHFKETDGSTTNSLPFLASSDGSIDNALRTLYETGSLPYHQYRIDVADKDDKRLGILSHFCKLLGFKISYYLAIEENNVEIRPELYSLMNEVWGYDSFRELDIYSNLNIDRSVKKISQGEIIETIIQQCEKANRGEGNKMQNVLLTSPTGSGKSLLFQLAAIYLAKKYNLLTIVVSPLVALMNDQVGNLIGNYDGVATMNGTISANEREQIKEDIQNGTKNILYLAPELLLSHSLSSFIGSRSLGLLVIDEAHTVTTWGRDFRVDYWFLGDYLRQAKKYLEKPFPIFALTATAVWDPSGNNDMVFDTIRSLYMDPCIKYIGVVRRENISFAINNPQINGGYEDWRMRLTASRIREAIKERRKTIVYFPFKILIQNLLSNREYLQEDLGYVTEYHGDLMASSKNLNAEYFRSGKCPIMCATKAYGMGIDVSDIAMVYHHAPSGNLSDYVQEIGRLARDPKIQGIARIDFTERDFKYTRMLHGLSTIKTRQLREVLKKLMAIYRLKGEKRNMLISATDFGYIFQDKNTIQELDQKVKSCLLLISNDLKNKLRFNAIIVRPKSLFTKMFLKVPSSHRRASTKRYANYIQPIRDHYGIYELNLEQLWTDRFRKLSFPQFKKEIMDGKVFEEYSVEIMNKINLSLLRSHIELVRMELVSFFEQAKVFLDYMAQNRKRLSYSLMKEQLPNYYSDIEREEFVDAFTLVYASKKSIGSDTGYCRTYGKTNTSEESFQLIKHGYGVVENLFLRLFDEFIDNITIEDYCKPNNDIVLLAELLNSLHLADYLRSGGDAPAIFVRINNPFYLNDLVRSNNYNNLILENIYKKYQFSETIFTHFFTTKMSDEQRWDFIEDYFLGATEEDLLKYGKE